MVVQTQWDKIDLSCKMAQQEVEAILQKELGLASRQLELNGGLLETKGRQWERLVAKGTSGKDG
jgi:hypothetical protein